MNDEKIHLSSNLLADTGAYSTLIDSLMFLLMVSISAVIILSGSTGESWVRASGEQQIQIKSSDILLSLLNTRVENLEYGCGSSQYELKHKTISEIISEQMMLKIPDETCSEEIGMKIEETLGNVIGDNYNYNLTTYRVANGAVNIRSFGSITPSHAHTSMIQISTPEPSTMKITLNMW